MTNAPLLILAVMVGALFVYPTRMMTITAITALATLAFSGQNAPQLLARMAPNFATVLLVMSATQWAARRILDGGLEERLGVILARTAAHGIFRRLPASIILPLIFVPTTMIVASILHNIVAIAVLVPLVLAIYSRFEVPPGESLSAMLISSNLGGASMAFGDTPAIIQRSIWNFTPGEFAAAMLPRNVVILAVLTAIACFTTWYPFRMRKTNWLEMSRRLKTCDEIAFQSRYHRASGYRDALIAGCVLISFILGQFFFPGHALLLACTAMLALLILTPEERRIQALTVLGLEPIIVIGSLFTVGAAVEQVPLLHGLSQEITNSRAGLLEIIAYFLTASISADGAAATLAPIVHRMFDGSMQSAWQLACGICAGSSVFLTSASAGPILYSCSKLHGFQLSFRRYAMFGGPFSVVMLMLYIVMNSLR